MRLVLVCLAILLGAALAPASDVLDIWFSSPTGGDVLFSHSVHVRTPLVNDNCEACHDKVYASGRSKRPVTMAEMEKGKSCGACHGRKAFSLADCGRCHLIKKVVFPVQPTGDVPFLHAPHTKKMQCGKCHLRLFKPGRNPKVTMAQMERGKSCGACHNGRNEVFALAACDRCHLAQTVNMQVTGAGPSPFSHGFHVKLYRCVDCHPKIFPLGYPEERPRVSMHEMESGKSCGACHDDYTAFTIRENCVRCHDM